MELLEDLPDDPLERLMRLLELEQAVAEEFEAAYAQTYFDARLTGQIDTAIEVRRHSRTEVLALTRRLNHESGFQVWWMDGLDPTSRR